MIKKKNINDNKKRTTFFKRVKQQWVLVGDLVTNVSRYLYKYNMVVILGFFFQLLHYNLIPKRVKLIKVTH